MNRKVTFQTFGLFLVLLSGAISMGGQQPQDNTNALLSLPEKSALELNEPIDPYLDALAELAIAETEINGETAQKQLH